MEFEAQRARCEEPSLPAWKELVAESREGKKFLVVLLRHNGCTFCREVLAKLKDERADIESQGVEIVLVHMSTREEAESLFTSYNLQDVRQISDPLAEIYTLVGLPEVSILRLFHPQVTLRALQGWFKGHGVGKLQGYGLQSQGAVTLQNGIVDLVYDDSTMARPLTIPEQVCERPLPASS